VVARGLLVYAPALNITPGYGVPVTATYHPVPMLLAESNSRISSTPKTFFSVNSPVKKQEPNISVM